ncbi:hypothetical protein SNOG_02102 [Parastagonospora nodorum SN15]|uniref:Uncharacterized protein n=1 Tax=Phaeosphaeria nodorum (strain SN15 / ATCC MYA-4574 / FGSC 10173) TaxID=321614 RepID=Q0V1L2_PHANO|nr:hypothetical protein SNOG_02102 [Parastagonospora nodorum SN15]EAT90314.1 hypothetical protein SNOG_02102 [Parastagonospora nodorum SN15]
MFTRSHLAQGGPVDITLQELQSKDLPLLETNSATACRTAHLRTVQSFATIFFGTKHKQPEITQRGYIQHGATLQQLNRALTEPHCYRYDEIIQSVMTLAIQETLVPSGANLFMKHMQGLEKLLALRDPDLYSPPSTVSLYKCLRHMLLFASLIGGTPSILARPDWKEMFHRHCANDKEEQEQQLYDFLADCSVLASKRDALLKKRTSGDGVTSDFDEVQRDALHLGDQLRAWRAEWAVDPTNAYVEISSSSVQPHGQPEDTSVPPSPTDLQFSNIKSALTLMLFSRHYPQTPSKKNRRLSTSKQHTPLSLDDTSEKHDAIEQQLVQDERHWREESLSYDEEEEENESSDKHADDHRRVPFSDHRPRGEEE